MLNYFLFSQRAQLFSTLLFRSCLLVFFLGHAHVHASDHADPMTLKRLEAGITGLFVFPDQEDMVVILAVRRALTAPAPYDFKNLRFSILMDLHTPVSFDVEQDQLRYGGTIAQPESISPDVQIDLQLNNDASLKTSTITGISRSDEIKITSNVYDDPFILPRFFSKNVVAMVLKIPLSVFPEEQKDWLIWATSEQKEQQIDHVGRANRTMLPRFDLLNTLPPSEHVAALKKRHETPKLLDDIKRVYISPLFASRGFDFVPDVMIYSKRYEAGFPNGRKLTDDVAALTCQLGDCLLWETSFIDSKVWPRQVTNDKTFLESYPYLAAPWPDKLPNPGATLTLRSKLTLAAIIIALIALLILPWLLYIGASHGLKKQLDVNG